MPLGGELSLAQILLFVVVVVVKEVLESVVNLVIKVEPVVKILGLV